MFLHHWQCCEVLHGYVTGILPKMWGKLTQMNHPDFLFYFHNLPQGATCHQRGDEHLCWWRVSFLDRHALDASVIHCLVEACFACRAKGTCKESKIQLMRVSESACVVWISLDAQLRLLFLNLHTECWMDLMLAVTAEVGGFEVCHAGSRKHRQHMIMTSHDFVLAHRSPCLRKQFLCNQLFLWNASSSSYVFLKSFCP